MIRHRYEFHLTDRVIKVQAGIYPKKVVLWWGAEMLQEGTVNQKIEIAKALYELALMIPRDRPIISKWPDGSTTKDLFD